MAKKATTTRKTNTVTVEFVHPPVSAQSVCLAGSFNDWNESATPMAPDESGSWSARLELAPGHYEFKFIVDGEWRCSPDLLVEGSPATCVPNDFGTENFAIEAGG